MTAPMLRAVPLVLLSLFAPVALARAVDERGDRAQQLLLDDVHFAERLARFRFFDLALEVLTEVKTGKLDATTEGTVLAAEADILKRQSEGLADETERLEVQTRGIEMLQDWARAGTPFVYHPERPDALENLWWLQHQRAVLRSAQMRDEADATRAETLRGLAMEDFKDATETLVTLQREYESLAEQLESEEKLDDAANLKGEASLCIYKRGLVLLDWADVEKDPTFRLEEAVDTLTEYQWALEDEIITQYYALHYQGVATRKLGRLDEAADQQAEVLERGQWFWDNRRVNPETQVRNEGVAPFVSELMDRAWGELARVRLDAGDAEAAVATIETMLAAHRDGKEPWSRAGLRVLLDLSEALAAAGRGGKAAELVKFASEVAPAGSPERDEAVGRLGELVAGGSGDEPASVLMAAAEGQFADRKFGDAAFTWARALAALRDEGERKEHEVAAWLGIGNALRAESRQLESALAYEQALEAATRHGAGVDVQAGAATSMYNAFNRRHKETADAFDKKLRDAASERLIALGVGEDVQFLNAKEAFDEALLARPQDPAAYLAAQQELQSVPETAPNYERSLIYGARALAGAGRTDEALAAFDAFLARVADPANAPVNTAAKGRREVALGECLYYKADLQLAEGVNRPADALATLEGFEERVPGQTGLIESVKYQRVVACAMLGDQERGTAAFDDLRAWKEDGKYVGLAAFRMADMLLQASTAKRDAGDAAAADALLARAADFMWLHCELAGFPSFANVANSGTWYARVGKPELALRSFEKALERFGADPDISEEQKDQARIGLATALNALHEFSRARSFWQDLMNRNPRHPLVMLGAARCYGGWLDLSADGATVTELPGSGHYAEAVKLWTDLLQSAAARKHQREWWEYKLGAVYALYREGSINPTKLAEARKVLDNARVFTPNYDGDTVGGLPADQQYQPLFKPLFKYLEKKIPER